MGLDTNSILNLINSLKENAKIKMENSKNQLQSRLLEYKRHKIENSPETQSKRSIIFNNQNEFNEARERYWLIKQIEWYLTRLEVAKYAAQNFINY